MRRLLCFSDLKMPGNSVCTLDTMYPIDGAFYNGRVGRFENQINASAIVFCIPCLLLRWRKVTTIENKEQIWLSALYLRSHANKLQFSA